ncbi:unnamed protein product [Sphenostylis stenocarpa]|uniref:Uncharacterized protein n=1 Tax=Sphenostylis stenocarpa TaxID=92480 RepID=A0AA86W2L8_9FABA|nr:unnamed protein product [Sphenostylis stenocarpa]
MTSPIGELTSNNDGTSGWMGTEQSELSVKTQGSECLQKGQRESGTVLTSSPIDEKSNQVSASVTENSVILPLASSNQVSANVTENSVILPPASSNQVSGNVTENSVILLPASSNEVSVDVTGNSVSLPPASSNKISANVTENSVILLPAPPQDDLEKNCQTVEGSHLEQSTDEQVPVQLPNDKSENPCPLSENEPVVSPCQPLSENKPVESPCQPLSENEPVESPCQSLSKNKPVESPCQPLSENVLVESPCQSLSKNKPVESPCQPLSENEPVESPCQSLSENKAVESPCQPLSENEPVESSFQSLPENKPLESPCQPLSENEPVESVPDFAIDGQMQSSPAEANMSSGNELLDSPTGDVNNISSICPERVSYSPTNSLLRRRGKRNSKLLKKTYMLRSIGSSDRALRSKTKENPRAPETNNNNDAMQRKSGRKKRKSGEVGIADQFSRIKSHLRYLLNRIGYEKNLIDAYSGEGWKGHSMEKLKPEKELQRAKSEILRRKLNIRDLFRNLDSLCAEGKLPESLFDSEGEIDSEDIFCAKCHSKELSCNNDIILCDGVCDRGFHQLCLDPPLLTADIPPGDEGWLCPGCDCKDDCMDLVNDSFGTSLCINDPWERVFPEAARAAGNNMDNNLGLPSDDSDDDDYNPNGPEDVKLEGDESSSDESDYASASEKLEGSLGDQYLGLPSEDSDDGDYNPGAPDVDCKVNEESSSSDFTSDSEDLAAAIVDYTTHEQNGEIRSASLDDVKYLKSSRKQKGKAGKKLSMADELSSLLEPDSGQDGSTPVSGKRNLERLDYKKLYDETYHSDTSDDEDWTATATPSRKKKGNVTPVSLNGYASNNSKHTPKRNGHQNKFENTKKSPAKSLHGCVKSDSRDRRSSAYKRLGEAVIQRLHVSFKENHYPDRTTKESLAQELGLTCQQVAKWFDNTRWSFRHSSKKETNSGRNALQQTPDSRVENEGDECELMSQEVSGEKSKAPSSRKRKRLSEHQPSEAQLDTNGRASSSPNTQQTLIGKKMKTRRRK